MGTMPLQPNDRWSSSNRRSVSPLHGPCSRSGGVVSRSVPAINKPQLPPSSLSSSRRRICSNRLRKLLNEDLQIRPTSTTTTMTLNDEDLLIRTETAPATNTTGGTGSNKWESLRNKKHRNNNNNLDEKYSEDIAVLLRSLQSTQFVGTI